MGGSNILKIKSYAFALEIVKHSKAKPLKKLIKSMI